MKFSNQNIDYKPAFGMRLDYSAKIAIKEAFQNEKAEINAIEQVLKILGHDEILIGTSHKVEKVLGSRIQGLQKKKSLIKTMLNFLNNSYTDIYEKKNFYAYFKGNKKDKMPLFDVSWYKREHRFGTVIETTISEYPEEIKIKLCNIDPNIKQALMQKIAQKRFEKLNP